MRTLCVLNRKGGSGKTTTAVNLGAGLARLGRRVLLADLDPQCHLTVSLGVTPPNPQQSMEALLRGESSLKQVTLSRDRVDLVPACPELSRCEVDLSSAGDGHTRLKDALMGVDGYHYLILDCPPHLGLLSVNALSAVRELLVPLMPDFLALQGLGMLQETVEGIRESVNTDLRISGIVLTRYAKAKKLHREVEAAVRSHFGSTLLRSRIRENVSVAEAPGFGKDIFAYAPGSNGALDYMELCREIDRTGDSR